MPRSKVTKKHVLESWEEVEGKVKRAGEIDAEIAEREARMNKAVERVKARYDEKVKPLKKERKGIDKEVHLYLEQHKEEFGAATDRTRKLTFGICGFEWTKGKITQRAGLTLDKIIEKLKRYRPGWLRTKTVHELDKEELARKVRAGEVKPEELDRYGLGWHRVDQPWYKPNEQNIGEAA